jgi:hypothetical protein
LIRHLMALAEGPAALQNLHPQRRANA